MMLLGKIQKAEYISDMYLNQYLYFKNLHDFRNSSIDSVGRHDPKEGNLKNLPLKYLSVSSDKGEIVLSKVLKNFSGQYTEHFSDPKISCCSLFSAMLEEDKELEVDERITQMGDKTLLICDIVAFFKILDKSLEKSGYEYSRKLVTYYDPKTFSGELTLHHKNKLYDFQKEYRILITPTGLLPQKIKMPGLKKICKVIDTNLMKTLRIKLHPTRL
jgi:hypothetical protein